MSELITVTSLEDAIKLATSHYWVESFFFANTGQGETDEENFNRQYQITERTDPDMVHYSRVD